jgi:hypothetical protein
MSSRSRRVLSRRRKTSSWPKAAFFIVGSITIATFLFLYGIPALVRLAILLESTASSTLPVLPSETLEPRPLSPTLYPPPLATNSAVLTIRGLAKPEQQIRIYLNNVEAANVLTRSDGEFSYTSLVLNPGKNQLFTATVNPQGEEIAQSRSYSITYQNEPPEIDIIEPEDNASFRGEDNPITVKGETKSSNSVQINNHLVVVGPDGQFSYSVFLAEGENTIRILAKDPAGNTTEKEALVSYTQEE